MCNVCACGVCVCACCTCLCLSVCTCACVIEISMYPPVLVGSVGVQMALAFSVVGYDKNACRKKSQAGLQRCVVMQVFFVP